MNSTKEFWRLVFKVVVVVLLVAVFGGLYAIYYRSVELEAKEEATAITMGQVDQAVQAFLTTNSCYPSDAEELRSFAVGQSEFKDITNAFTGNPVWESLNQGHPGDVDYISYADRNARVTMYMIRGFGSVERLPKIIAGGLPDDLPALSEGIWI